MESNDLISVIIPTYNRTHVIKKAIDSVLKQTYQKFELIIVDDFSDDVIELENIIKCYNDKRITLHKNKKNLNGAVSRNIGIDLAKGEYIAFLDSDDEWYRNKLEIQLKFAKNLKNDKFLIYTKSKRFGKQFTQIAPEYAKKSEQTIADYLFVDDGYMPTPSFFLPTFLAKQIKFNPKLRRHQDYDFLMKLEEQNVEFVLIDEVLVKIYSDPNSKSEQRGASYERSLYFLEEYKKYFSRDSYNNFWLKNVAFYMSRNGQRTKAIREIFVNKRFYGVKFRIFMTYFVYICFVETKFYSLLEKIYVLMKKGKE